MLPSWISQFRVYCIISKLAQLNSYSTIKYESIQVVNCSLLEIHETHYANKLCWYLVQQCTKLHHFMFEFSKIFWGGAHRAPSPDPSPRFFSGFALDARATPSMLGRFAPSARASPSMSPHQRMHIRYHTGTSFYSTSSPALDSRSVVCISFAVMLARMI